jgi:hypothetical protein
MLKTLLIAAALAPCILACAGTTLHLEVFSLQSVAGQTDPSVGINGDDHAPVTVPANAKRIWQREYLISMTPLSIEEVFKGSDNDNVGISFEVKGLDTGTCFVTNYKFAASPGEDVALLKNAE